MILYRIKKDKIKSYNLYKFILFRKKMLNFNLKYGIIILITKIHILTE